jgi:hypothetical protein
MLLWTPAIVDLDAGAPVSGGHVQAGVHREPEASGRHPARSAPRGAASEMIASLLEGPS